MNRAADTIAAVATPPGQGAVGIIRISGPRVPAIATALLGRLPAARRATLGPFRDADGSSLDQGLALYFPAPHSFTGEHVLELQGHGGPVVLDLVLQRLTALGARLARPGEFSERAFVNGKLDLAQAEAVADLIASGSATAARSALRSLRGAFSRRVRELVRRLTELRVQVEAAIDFPEEEPDLPAERDLARRLAAVATAATELAASARQGSLQRDGMTVVLAGPPNAGKSSLLNVLAQQDSAIVSSLPGTTRDVLREEIQLDGMPLHVVDTAGLRPAGDPIEREGVRRAREAIHRADRVLLVIDDSADGGKAVAELLAGLPSGPPCTVLHNKIDLSRRPPALDEDAAPARLFLSARTGAGLDLLRAHLKRAMGYRGTEDGVFIARRRHLDAIARARGHLAAGQEQFDRRAPELLAEELRLAQQALGEITGEFTSDDLLGEIFSSFCLGK